MAASHDPDLALEDLHDGWVVGGGRGAFNLNAHRCGTLNGVTVFEKIYLRDPPGWRRLDWAYSSILPRLAGQVRTARLMQRLEGRKLAAAYFEYLPDLTRPSRLATLDAALAFRHRVADLDLSEVAPELADFRSEPMFARAATRLQRILIAAGRDPADLGTLVKSFLVPGIPRIFTHGDLVPENVGVNGVLIDWDRCGAYHKRALCGAWEKSTFIPGDTPLHFACGDLTVGVAICYDVEFPEIIRAEAGAGPELLLARLDASSRDTTRAAFSYLDDLAGLRPT